MESRVEHYGPRSATMNAKPAMFQAGLSTKFTKRHVSNFHDSSLTAASAAKARTELKMERQATAIEKQQQKIEHEMKKIEAITEKLQRQQAREAKRLRNRLVYAATRIQRAFRSHVAYRRNQRRAAAMEIQRMWRGLTGRQRADEAAREHERLVEDFAAHVITRNVRVFASRVALHHEIQWKEYAATTIQSTLRRHHARLELIARRNARRESERHERAATLIQAHTRGFLTRLVYMDVLYLVCRIQSVARGFLVRKRLRWLLSLNLHGIIALQALARGFLVRRRIQWIRSQNQVADTAPAIVIALDLDDDQPRRSRMRRTSKPRLPSAKDPQPSIQPRSVRPPPSSPSRQATYALATMASVRTPLATSPLRIKRSYWLPSGASSTTTTTTSCRPPRQRLPHLLPHNNNNRPLLASSSPSLTCATGEGSSFEDVAFHVVTIQRMVRGKFTKHRPPLRLEPIVRRSEEDEKAAKLVAIEERREREEIFKSKRMVRKLQEKKRADIETMMHQQQEKEDAERKLMDREEKVVRLWLKTTQRRHHEVRRRRQTLEQKREEKERMDMLREERLVRLYRKRLHRLAHKASLHRHGSRQEASLESSEESDDGESSIARDRREEMDQKAKARVQPPRRQTFGQHHPVPVPDNTKPSKQRHTTSTNASSLSLKKTRQLRVVYGGGGRNQSLGTRNDANDLLQTQYASWNFHSDHLATKTDIVDDDAEFDYGNDFDDVVEETKLSRLLC